MAQTFYPVTPTEITASARNDWVTMDASALAPANATGVILHIVSAESEEVGLRKPGSTDDRYNIVDSGSHLWAMIGVDANRYFEAYVGDTDLIDIYVVGYTMAGVTFKTNADDMSLGSTEDWYGIDCSTEAPSAVGLIFDVPGSAEYDFGLRKNGSTDDRQQALQYHSFAIIGCDGSQICEGYIENTGVDFFLVGYITDGCTFNTNATDVSLGSTGEYLDLTALPDESPNMGIIEVCPTVATTHSFGLRKNGQSGGYYDIYEDAEHHPWAVVECDESRLIEGKIETTDVDFFVVGYSTAITITEKNVSDTGSGVDATVALLATLVKSDSGSGVDAFTGNRGFILPDAGVGVEALGDRDLGAAETGIGEELASLLAERIRADTGMGMDAIISFLTSVSKFGSDSGVGADVAVLKAFLDRLDTGQGIEAILSRDIVKAETGAGMDIAALLAAFTKSDEGTGLDQGEKLSIDQILQAVDSGVGVDVAVVSCIGQLLKLIAFTRSYRDLKVYTRPYRDLKVYTDRS